MQRCAIMTREMRAVAELVIPEAGADETCQQPAARTPLVQLMSSDRPDPLCIYLTLIICTYGAQRRSRIDSITVETVVGGDLPLSCHFVATNIPVGCGCLF